MISNTRFSIQTEVARQQALSSQIAQLQTNISTGIKVHVASDDPVAARRIAQIQATQSSQTTWESNITIATQVSSQVEDSMNNIQTQLTRAKELILAAQTQSASPADRASIATEMQGIVSELDTISKQTDFTGAPLYAASGSNPVAIPVGPDLAISAADSYDRVFGSVTLADGSTSSISAILTSAIGAIQSGNATAMTASSAAIDASASHVSGTLTDAGVRTQRIQTADDRLQTAKIDLSDERSSLESTDVTAAAADLVQKQTQLQAAQSILAQLAKNTLFDKLA